MTQSGTGWADDIGKMMNDKEETGSPDPEGLYQHGHPCWRVVPRMAHLLQALASQQFGICI